MGAAFPLFPHFPFFYQSLAFRPVAPPVPKKESRRVDQKVVLIKYNSILVVLLAKFDRSRGDFSIYRNGIVTRPQVRPKLEFARYNRSPQQHRDLDRDALFATTRRSP